MNADELKALQTPLKAKYRDAPESALATLRAEGTVVVDSVSCRIEANHGTVNAGLHPATGGDGSWACSAEMLLEALVGCAGVTLGAVATAMAIPLRKAKVVAEGTLDFRGTLGVSKETPVGFRSVAIRFELDTDAPREQVETLVRLVERYCVVFQTLKTPTELTTELRLNGIG